MPEGLVKTCASGLLPVNGTGTLLATGNLHSLVTVSGRRGIRQGNREAVIRCHNQSGLLQFSMRCTQINPGLGLGPQRECMSSPRAGMALRPVLARSILLDTRMEKSLRKIGRNRQGKQLKEVCFWLILSRGFPPTGASSRVLDTQGSHLRHAPVGLVLKSYLSWSRNRKSLRALPKYYLLVSRVLAFTGQRTGL
jgi:hypothetical protein